MSVQPENAPCHCPQCGGGSLRWHPEEAASHCSDCGRVTFLNSKPSAGAVIVREGRVLLVHDGGDAEAGWDLPGGFLLYGEPPEDGLRREVLEELGVDIEVGRLLAAIVDRYGDAREFSLNLFYEASIEAGRPRAAAEVAACEWFLLDDLPAIRFPSTRRVLGELE